MSEDYGKFSKDPKTQWLTDPSNPDRDMKLLEDFWYLDPKGKKWIAPAGSIVNGASIPQLFWTFVGSPLTDDYRLASIVHDVACVQKTAPWQVVHRMFYYACRCGGVKEIKAKIMYGAVWRFGPRWDPQTKTGMPMAPTSETRMNRDFEALKQFIGTENPSLERIEKFAEQ